MVGGDPFGDQPGGPHAVLVTVSATRRAFTAISWRLSVAVHRSEGRWAGHDQPRRSGPRGSRVSALDAGGAGDGADRDGRDDRVVGRTEDGDKVGIRSDGQEQKNHQQPEPDPYPAPGASGRRPAGRSHRRRWAALPEVEASVRIRASPRTLRRGPTSRQPSCAGWVTATLQRWVYCSPKLSHRSHPHASASLAKLTDQ